MASRLVRHRSTEQEGQGSHDPLHRFTYAIADPHGCVGVLKRALGAVDLSGDAHLYLLGDYVPHETTGFGAVENGLSGEAWAARCAESLELVRAYEAAHPGKVSVLPGNHELMLLDRVESGELEMDRVLLRWLQGVAAMSYFETERQIFVHAGVDEEAGDWWRWGSDAWFFCGKFPPSFGTFEKDVIAGHVGAQQASRYASEQGCEVASYSGGVFWDGESHYYLDATTERSGRINILCYDARLATYTQRFATASDVSAPQGI